MRAAVLTALTCFGCAVHHDPPQPIDQCGGAYFYVLSPAMSQKLSASLDVHLEIELQDVTGHETFSMIDDLGQRYTPTDEQRTPGQPAYLTEIVRHYELSPGRRMTLAEQWCCPGAQPCDDHSVEFDTLP